MGWVRVRAAYAGNPNPPLKIYFDQFTSGGGKQKGYVTCRQVDAHGNCVCWKNVFGQLEDYCSYMVAWEQASGFANRTEHMGFVPPESMIATVRATLDLEQF